MLRQFFLLVLIFVSGCAGPRALPEPGVSAAQKESADSLSWDFGFARAGEILRHDFILKNDTAKVLNIKEVSSSCGCTASAVKKKTLLPQESAVIEVKFDSKGYSGGVTQYVYVHTDNLDNSIIRYIIKADVIK